MCQYYDKTLKLPNTRFKFTFVSEDSILKILKNIDENKAAGLDHLSGKFLKDGATILAKPLSQICNLSIKYSTLPNDCKTAKLKPLFKRGSKTDSKNYRPISVLPLISKIIEKFIHDQTQSFLDKNNIIYRYQSGFRKFYSTDSCLSYLNNKIATGFESELFTGMILIDLQKAFDTKLFYNNFLKNYLFQQKKLLFEHVPLFKKLKIPRRKTNIGLKSLSYTGPSLWNNLNENLKRSSSINDFKHKIRVLFRRIKKKKT